MIKKTKNKNTSSQSLATNKLSTASDNTLISVLENLPIGVVVFNSNKILFLNKIALKVFKTTKELKKTIYNHSIFDFLLPEYHKRIKENNIKILNGEHFEPFELKIRNAKNEIIDLEVKSNAIIFNATKSHSNHLYRHFGASKI
jgi:c-di-AMP phosphodiesterase-like protein